MAERKVRRDEHSGAEIEGDAKLTLPNGETINLPYLKVSSSTHTRLGLRIIAIPFFICRSILQDSAGNHFVDIRKLYSG